MQVWLCRWHCEIAWIQVHVPLTLPSTFYFLLLPSQHPASRRRRLSLKKLTIADVRVYNPPKLLLKNLEDPVCNNVTILGLEPVEALCYFLTLCALEIRLAYLHPFSAVAPHMQKWLTSFCQRYSCTVWKWSKDVSVWKYTYIRAQVTTGSILRAKISAKSGHLVYIQDVDVDVEEIRAQTNNCLYARS